MNTIHFFYHQARNMRGKKRLLKKIHFRSYRFSVFLFTSGIQNINFRSCTLTGGSLSPVKQRRVFTMRIVTWNINGIRTFRGGIKKALDSLNADIICVQETKVTSKWLTELCSFENAVKLRPIKVRCLLSKM